MDNMKLQTIKNIIPYIDAYRGTSIIGIIDSFNKRKYKTEIYRPQEVSCFYNRDLDILLVATVRLTEPLGEYDGYNNLLVRILFLDRKIKLCLIK